MKTQAIHTGCSSFNESYWKGVFYPEDLPRKDWFAYYCQHFDTYEMNGTFYKFPTAKALGGWYQKSPDGFLFAVKMYRGVTHYKRFRDCSREIAEFYAICREQLKEKLACVLFQLPASFSYSDENLQLVIDALDYSFDNVIEFRNNDWWRQEVYDALRERNITFCNVSYPKLPDQLIATNAIGYVRLHGVPKLFYSGYSDAFLQNLKVSMGAQHWEKAFVYFNNTASAEGVRNALTFQKSR
jgi:uncharacterized protein YecE (DUF72 family)